MRDLEESIRKLLAERPIPVELILELIAEAIKIGNPEDLPIINRLAKLDNVMDQYLAVPAMSALPAWGSEGLRLVMDQAFTGPNRAAAFSILGAIAQGRSPNPKDVLFLPKKPEWPLSYTIPDELSAEALRLIRAKILDCIADPDDKSSLIMSIASLGIIPVDIEDHTSWFSFYMDLLIDSHLLVNHSMLQEFEDLLDGPPDKEEELQKFLTDHPVLLDPFVTELRLKHQLGDDFITDFVIRRVNNEYILVEIENSTDRIFTKDGIFTAVVTKALSQVRDFQSWIAENIAYAQKKLPGIRRPEGLVIIGRRNDLDEMGVKRLDEENYSRRGHAKIITFDDLLNQAREVHRNLINRPVVLRAKDQRTI